MTRLRAGLLGAVASGLVFYGIVLTQHRPKVVAAKTFEPALPTQLSIHGEPWVVTPVDMSSNDTLGVTYCEARTIVIGVGQSPGDAAEVLVHEGMHALTCLGDDRPHNWLYNNGESDHKGIHWAAPHIVDLFAENPALVSYVARYGRTLTPVTAMTAGGPGGDKPTPAVEVAVGKDKGER